MAVEARLHCHGLQKAFGGVQALAGVDIELPPEGLVAVIGPNGAGKTTWLNCVTGFCPPDAGCCFLNGRDTTGLPPEKMVAAGVARTFQDLRLVEQATAIENVTLACPDQRGETLWGALTGLGVAQQERSCRQRALACLDDVGLAQVAETPTGALSHGQQKLLALACCLATGADVLLLDEPVAGVHPDLAESILQVLQRLRAQSRLVVFIEHNIAAVRSIAEQVVIMDSGRVLAFGPPAQVLGLPEVLEAYFG